MRKYGSVGRGGGGRCGAGRGSCGVAVASISRTSNSGRRRQCHVALRGSFSLLWLALLAVGTGPAACFVVPCSARLRGPGLFAAASPVPRFVPGASQGSCGSRSSNSSSSNGVVKGGRLGYRDISNSGMVCYRDQRRTYAFARGGMSNSSEDFVGDRSLDGDEGDQEAQEEEAGRGSSRCGDGRQTKAVDTTHTRPPTCTRFRNARGFKAVTALTAGKGLRAAASALRASSISEVDGGDSGVEHSQETPKRILILMSDTGGGHRASSQALTAALKELYGNQIHADIVDIWTDYGRFPFANAVKTYKFLGRHPILWKLSYDMARFPLSRRWAEIVANLTCHRSFRRCLEKYQPDLVVSTHPLCHHVPLRVLKRLRKESGKEIPFVTVVTDLGSAHPTWFDPRGDLVYVPSDVLRHRAHARGIPQNKLMQFGLPVRDAFWEERVDKREIQQKLGLKMGVRTALIVGGGDGVGKLHDIATSVADRLASDKHPGQVVVVCGTNQRTKEALENHPWPDEDSGVNVRVLGFVSNMDEWMSASDLLVTKAGPGTIAEACTRGLPVILSSFLPGQEAGNVPYVTDNDFGLYRKDPGDIAHEVSDLLSNKEKLDQMGDKARSMGRPHASLDIARSLVSTMLPGTVEVRSASPSSPSSSSSPSTMRSA